MAWGAGSERAGKGWTFIAYCVLFAPDFWMGSSDLKLARHIVPRQ